jgi:hypothetical protein
MTYPYTSQNRLVEPHAYMYTAFQGVSFLRDYLSDRDFAIRRYASRQSVGARADSALAVRAFHVLEQRLDVLGLGTGRELRGIMEKSIGRDALHTGAEVDSPWLGAALDSTTTADRVTTQELLLGLISAQLTDTQSKSAGAWLDRLVQRFEVTKKIYDAYQPGFRKGEGSHYSLRLYSLFALALCLFYAQTRDLRYLNSLLKTCDLLCSLDEVALHGELPGPAVILVLAAESVYVRALARNKGVRLAAA